MFGIAAPYGFLAKTRILNDDYELYDGMHEPIITEEQWEPVKAAQKKRNHASVNTDRQLQNPFAGILVCGKCGAIMNRTVPDKRRNPTPWFRCTTRGCDCKIIKCEVVENSIRDAMQEWLDEYTIQIEADLLRQQSESSQKKQETVQIIPTTQHILESYPILSPAEKNRRWKLVMKKATVYRSQDDKLMVSIYPNLPK